MVSPVTTRRRRRSKGAADGHDRGDDAGQIRFAEGFSPADRLATGLDNSMTLAKLTPEHRVFLAWHRAHLLTAAASRSVDR